MSEKKPRKCPECGKRFKDMTDKQFRVALINHLIGVTKHNWTVEKAIDYVNKFLPI